MCVLEKVKTAWENLENDKVLLQSSAGTNEGPLHDLLDPMGVGFLQQKKELRKIKIYQDKQEKYQKRSEGNFEEEKKSKLPPNNSSRKDWFIAANFQDFVGKNSCWSLYTCF